MWQQKLGTAFSDLKKNTAQHALIAPWREQNYALPPPHAKQIRHIILYFPMFPIFAVTTANMASCRNKGKYCTDAVNQ